MLLKDSITPFLQNFKLTYDRSLVEMIVPRPESINSVRKNEALTFFVFFNEKLDEIEKT